MPKTNTPKKTSTRRPVLSENEGPFASPSKSKSKMTKEEKFQLRERARMAMMGLTSPTPKAAATKPSPKAKTFSPATTKARTNVKTGGFTFGSMSSATTKTLAPSIKKVKVNESFSVENVEHYDSEEEYILDNSKTIRWADNEETSRSYSIKRTPPQMQDIARKPVAKKPIVRKEEVEDEMEVEPKEEVSKTYTGVAKSLFVDLQSKDGYQVLQGLQNLQSYVVDLSNNHAKEADLLGAGSIVVLTMQKWKTNALILQEGCCFINAYANVSSWGKNALLRSGGIEVVVKAMEDFPSDNQGLYKQAIRALGSLSFLPFSNNKNSRCIFPGDAPANSDMRQAWKPFISEHGGVDYIVSAINLFTDMPEDIANCAALLSNLLAMRNPADVADLKMLMRDAEAPITVFTAMQKHHDHARLSQHGSAFIGHFKV